MNEGTGAAKRSRRPKPPKNVSYACTSCQKRRIRCDGLQPCNRCVHSRKICTYNNGGEHGDLRSHRPTAHEYEDLVRRKAILNRLIDAIRGPDTGGVLQKIKEGADLNVVAQSLGLSLEPAHTLTTKISHAMPSAADNAQPERCDRSSSPSARFWRLSFATKPGDRHQEATDAGSSKARRTAGESAYGRGKRYDSSDSIRQSPNLHNTAPQPRLSQ